MLVRLFVLFLAFPVAASTPLTIEDYVTMPSFGSVEFSPDGRRIAYVLTRGDLTRNVYDSDVWVVDADGGNHMQLTRGSRTKNVEFKVMRGPSNRWYVEDVDYDSLQADFCRS